MTRANIRNRFAGTIIVLALIVSGLILAACSSSNVLASDVRNISDGLNCICGNCDELVSECDCETAEQLTTQVTKALSRGHSTEKITQDLTQRYGQRILAVAATP